MKYKALFIDVDGTLLPNADTGVPSQKVTDAIAKAKKKIHVGLVTGRPMSYLHNIFDHLQLDGPSIVTNGAEIVDSVTRKVLWQQPLLKEDIAQVQQIIHQFAKRVKVNDNGVDSHLVQDQKYSNPLGMYIDSLPVEVADSLVSALSHIPTVSAGKMISWTTGQIDVWVAHVNATKQHGILRAAEILGINTKEIIGIGDGYNDFPLMMACGFRVAMGNAIDDLKAICDYIAPSVENDGVADVIEKFILKSS